MEILLTAMFLTGIGFFAYGLIGKKIKAIVLKEFKFITAPLDSWQQVLFAVIGIILIIFVILSMLGKIPVTEATVTSTPTATSTPTVTYETTNTVTQEEIFAITPTVTSNPSLTMVYLDFEEYKDGETSLDFGSNLIVRSAKEKYVTGLTSDGKIEIDDLNLTDFFEVEIRADFTQAKVKIILGTQDGGMAVLSFGENDLVVFGNTTKHWSETGWNEGDAINSLRIISNGDGLDFFINYSNDSYFGKFMDSSYALYTKLIITGIDQNQKIFSIRIANKK